MLIGDTVSIKGTSNGTITDMDGNFLLDVLANVTIILSIPLKEHHINPEV